MKFQCYHWEKEVVKQQQKRGKNQFNDIKDLRIFAWCLNENSENYLIILTGFKPYVLFQLQAQENPEALFKFFSDRYRYCAPISYRLTRKRDLYYSNNLKREYMELYFTSDIKRKIFASKLRQIEIEDDDEDSPIKHIPIILEDDINVIRQFMTEIDMKFTQWFELKNSKELKSNSLNQFSDTENQTRILMANYNSIVKLENVMIITKPLVFSWDIECYSDVHNMMPNSLFAKHAIFMISVVVKRLGEEKKTKYLLTFLDIYQEQMNGIEVIKTDNEIDMINSFFDLIIFINPDILITHNGLRFDFPFLINRLEIKSIKIKNTGRIKSSEEVEIRTINWESSAYGIQELSYIHMQGRIMMDTLVMIQRDYKFDNYKLDTLAKEILKDSKDDVTPKEMFVAYEEITKNKCHETIQEMTRIAKYCIQDSDLVIRLLEKMNLWIGYIELSSIAGINVFELYTGGQGKRCLSLICDYTRKHSIAMKEIKEDHQRAKGALVRNPVPGIHDRVMTLDFKSLYPSIIIAFNLCYTTLIQENELDEYNSDEYTEVEAVFETETRKLYFAKKQESVLPTLCKFLIQERNNVKKIQKNYSKDSLDYLILGQRELGLKVMTNSIYGFAGRKKGRYIIPQISAAVTAKGRISIEECRDYLEKNYNAKVIYGDTDSVMFSVPSITTDRECLVQGPIIAEKVSSIFEDPLTLEFEKAGRIFLQSVKKKYLYWIIGNDGDLQHSIQFKLNEVEISSDDPRLSQLSWDLSDESKYKDQIIEINQDRFERIVIPKLMNKGVTLARRDGFKIQRELFRDVTQMIIKKREFNEVFDYIFEYCLKILRREFDHTNFITSKKIGKKNYKSKNHPTKLFVNKLKSKGTIVNSGEKIEYLIIEEGIGMGNVSSTRTGDKMIDIKSFIESNGEMKTDVVYYLEHFINHMIEVLISSAYGEELKIINEKYHRNLALKKITLFYDLLKDISHKNQFIKEIIKRDSDILEELLEDIKDEDDARIIIDETIDELNQIRGLKGLLNKIVSIVNSSYNINFFRNGDIIKELIKIIKLKQRINQEILKETEWMRLELK
jgi:DNA polymerase elongation subunit (family B)